MDTQTFTRDELVKTITEKYPEAVGEITDFRIEGDMIGEGGKKVGTLTLQSNPSKYEELSSLVEELLGSLTDVALPEGWLRRYYLHTGEHMILGPYGWEPGECKADYIKEDPDWKPADEVNAPEGQQYPRPATMAEFLSLRPDTEIYLDDDSAEGTDHA